MTRRQAAPGGSLKRWSPLRLCATCAVAAGAWGLVAVICLCFGSTGMGWPTGPEVLHLRMAFVRNASIIGAALAAAGVAYQAILRNPLADPYLLGTSSGAMLAVYVWGLTAAALGPMVHGLSEPVIAFAGAMAALGVVLVLARQGGRLEPVSLLLVGVIVNSVCGSVYLLLFYLDARFNLNGAQGGSPLRFLVGGINASLSWQQIVLPGLGIGAAWLGLMYLGGQLNVATLSEAEAQSLGVNIHGLRWSGLVLASVATAAAVALSGPIGFVGLVCPHVGRLLVGNDQRWLLPVATALGACLLAVADTVSRQLGQAGLPALPVGVLTGLIGGPFFLVLLWRGRRGRGVLV